MTFLSKIKQLLRPPVDHPPAGHGPFAGSTNPMPPESEERAMQQQNPEGAKGNSGPL